jgi:hypothetical protein
VAASVKALSEDEAAAEAAAKIGGPVVQKTFAEMLVEAEARIAELEQALREVRAFAAGEQARPTDLHMTCLSLIEKVADKALLQPPRI